MGTWKSTFKKETISRSTQKQNIVQEKKFKYDSSQKMTTSHSCEEYLHCHEN